MIEKPFFQISGATLLYDLVLEHPKFSIENSNQEPSYEHFWFSSSMHKYQHIAVIHKMRVVHDFIQIRLRVTVYTYGSKLDLRLL